MPDKAFDDIDHLLTYVLDIEAAASLFRRMGFTLSPISHIEAMGISNYLVPMRPATKGCANFIELMSAQDRKKLPPAMTSILAGQEGIKSMVLSTKNAVAAQAAMRMLGFDAAPPVHVKREWIIGPGESVFPEFDVILPFKSDLAFNGCQYHNVDLYLRPQWLEHPNGAQGIRTVLSVAANPAALARRFAALFDALVSETEGAARVTAGGVELAIFSPEAARVAFGTMVTAPESGAVYLGYVVEVRSLAALTASLHAGNIDYRTGLNVVYVDPAIGLGNLIVFEPPNGS